MKNVYTVLLLITVAINLFAQSEEEGFSLSSYSEMIYQNFDYGPNQRATPNGAKKDRRAIIDIPRFILNAEYHFLPDLYIESEIEFEHLGTGAALELEYEEFGEYEFESEKGGEIIIEELFINKSFSDEINLRVGKFPIPFSLLNKVHKPTDFFATVRPESESMIIPSLWTEIGLELFGSAYNFYYRLAVVNGLNSAGFSSERWIAEGMQTKFETINATDLAVAARLDFCPGHTFLVGGSFYYGNSSGNRPKPEDMSGIDAHISLFSFHLNYLGSPIILRGDFIYGNLENSDIVTQRNSRLSNNTQYPRSPVAKNAIAWYGEGGYDISSFFSLSEKYRIYPFFRFEHYNTMLEVESGIFANSRFNRSVITAGFNVIWNDEIVFKADYSSRKVGEGFYNTENTIGIGIGYNTYFIK